ncbi:hypothetical protein M3C58_02390 [Brachybacterium muris]|uniref:hypothetical protein n=1 Tax=Brachybacterium muris TaxID=219301 RepID=UPI0021A2F4D3|nr:hypothetical protein [Brachybacterium muris]MCT1997063.1 hypothetical protein [Brachybacterium muris]
MRHFLSVANTEERCKHLESILAEAHEVGVPVDSGLSFEEALRWLVPGWAEDDPVRPDLRGEAHFRKIGEPYPVDTGPYYCANVPELAAHCLDLLAKHEDAPTANEVAEWMPKTLVLAHQHHEAVREERRLERGF